jgi:hypothetical protein
MKFYTDDCPYIEPYATPDSERQMFPIEHSFEEWQPFRLNINIIGYNNKFDRKEKWWKTPRIMYKLSEYRTFPKNIFIK